MLKPSKKAGGSPLIAEGKPVHASKQVMRPNIPDSTKNRVLVSEGKAAGKRHTPTFTAPRVAASEDDISRGYKKVG